MKTVIVDGSFEMNEIIGNQIRVYQLKVWRQALKLESLGMTRRGPSMTSILKKRYGLGRNESREKVLEILEKEIEEQVT